MERVFIKDCGRFKKGERRDYPLPTWKMFFPGYEKFTKPVGEVLKNSVEKEEAA